MSATTHISDEKLTSVIGPFPSPERGVPTVIGSHPSELRILYPSRSSVVVRNLQDASDTFVYHGHQSPVTVAKFSPSGCWVASADEAGKVRVWAWDNPEHPLKVEVMAFAGRIIDLAWDAESKRIVVVVLRRFVLLFVLLPLMVLIMTQWFPSMVMMMVVSVVSWFRSSLVFSLAAMRGGVRGKRPIVGVS